MPSFPESDSVEMESTEEDEEECDWDEEALENSESRGVLEEEKPP